MLRIQRSIQDGIVRLTLSGRIDAEHLSDLRRLIEGEDPQGRLTLDLEEVKLVDQDAVRFLARCEAAGATLEGCAAYVREWITRERAEGNKPHRKTRNRRNPER